MSHHKPGPTLSKAWLFRIVTPSLRPIFTPPASHVKSKPRVLLPQILLPSISILRPSPTMPIWPLWWTSLAWTRPPDPRAMPAPLFQRASTFSMVQPAVKPHRSVDQERRRRVDHPLGCDDAVPRLEARSEA